MEELKMKKKEYRVPTCEEIRLISPARLLAGSDSALEMMFSEEDATEDAL